MTIQKLTKFNLQTTKLRGEPNARSTAADYLNLASSLISVGRIDEAQEKNGIAEKLIQSVKTGDADNKEIVLDGLNVYNLKQKILIRQGKFDAALETIKNALEIAENAYRNDSTNVEAINWVGHFSKETANLLAKQGKEREARVYLDVYDDYA